MNRMMFFILLMLCISKVQSETNSINVIGIVPDVSTREQVENLKAEFGYVIGGYELHCTSSYIDGKLSLFLCLTGEDAKSRDRTTDSFRLASNTEIHETLVKGFTEKFGSPSTNNNEVKINGFGTQFNRNTVVWVDKKGNELTLLSLGRKVGEGMLSLDSAKELMKYKTERSKAESKRDF